MKLIVSGLVMLGLLAWLVFFIFIIYQMLPKPSPQQPQAVCDRTAERFVPGPAAGEVHQAFSPYNGLDAGAWALAALADGSLVVGGDFTYAGGIFARHVALWNSDARTWQPVGEGLPDPVQELISTHHGDLYALTRFQSQSLPAAYKIYHWQNPVWQVLPDLFAGPAADWQVIEAMVSDGQDGFFLGGNFSAAGGLAVNGLIHWNGQAWQPLEGDLPENGLLMVRALALTSGGRLLAGGTLKTARNRQTELVLAWDGSRWSAIANALPGPVESLAAASDDRLSAMVALSSDLSWALYTLAPNAMRWVASTLAFPFKDVQFRMVKENEKVGVAALPISVPQSELAAWDSSLWQARARPFQLTYDPKRPIRLYVVQQKVIVVGVFDWLGGTAAANIAVWDGQSWGGLVSTNQAVDGLPGTVKSLAVDHQGFLYAGGNFKTAGASLAANIARWDNGAWSPLAGGLNGAVSALVIDQRERVIAGGTFSQAGGLEAYGLARYDPASGSWEDIGNRARGGFGMVSALAIAPDGTLYAAGYGTYQEEAGYYVSAWDGQQWKVLPGKFNDEIATLLVDRQGRVFAGGRFRMVSNDLVIGLARWDESNGRWLNLGSSIGWSKNEFNQINALLEAPDGSLLVGGNFSVVDGKPVCHIARLLPDANQGKGNWEPLAGGLPGSTRWFLVRMAACMPPLPCLARIAKRLANWWFFHLLGKPGSFSAGTLEKFIRIEK